MTDIPSQLLMPYSDSEDSYASFTRLIADSHYPVVSTLYSHNHVVFKTDHHSLYMSIVPAIMNMACKNHMHTCCVSCMHTFDILKTDGYSLLFINLVPYPPCFANVNYVTGLACGRYEYTWYHTHLAQHVSSNEMSFVNYRYHILIPQLIYTNHLFIWLLTCF